jgi:matrix metalloproteinase-14 (membrane-inserted)
MKHIIFGVLLAAAFLSSNQLFSSKKRIDAAVEWGNGKVYIFRGNQYFRYDIKADQVDAGYPKPINQTNWSGVPWTDGIDAAVNWGNGKVYIFKGNEYVRFDIKADKVDPGYPKPINQTTWPGLPWTNGIDAALNWGNGKVCIFKGDQYVRYDIASDKVDAGYPKPINQTTWPGLPWTDGIDSAVNWGNGKVYIFKGDQYVRYDIALDKADAGYPKPIDQVTWPGL